MGIFQARIFWVGFFRGDAGGREFTRGSLIALKGIFQVEIFRVGVFLILRKYYQILNTSTSMMNVKRLKTLYLELYETINKLKPNFIRDLFKLRITNRSVREKYRMNMIIPEFIQVS